MELYLDSADIKEIKEAFQLGFLTGLTTTPTFMHRHGITDIDGTILELAKIVPVLQIEALGQNAEEIVAEAKRQDQLGLDKSRTVYKIPISIEGLKACKMLVNQGFMVNIHLVYTLQQAYMAMQAGATYVCPLVGRLQDQGHDALSLVEQCVEAVNYYDYPTKIMFSSVRNAEHVRNAINIGVHTITVPWKIMKALTDNHFTAIGTQEFVAHTRLMTLKVKDVIGKHNPMVSASATISDCLVEMTKGGFGAVSIVDDKQEPVGIFTDGDLRRWIGINKDKSLKVPVSEVITMNKPVSVDADELLYEASKLFQSHQVDTLIVTDHHKVVGMLDIQDMMIR